MSIYWDSLRDYSQQNQVFYLAENFTNENFENLKVFVRQSNSFPSKTNFNPVLLKGECTKMLLERYQTVLKDLHTEPVTKDVFGCFLAILR